MNKKKTESKFDEAFVKAVSSQQDHLTKLNLSIGELILDEIIENEALKPLPGLSIVYGLYKTGQNVNERFFFKKVQEFLLAANNIPDDEKQRFLAKMASDQKFKNRVVEKTMVILDKLNEMEKVEVLSNLFKNLVLEKIDFAQYSRYCFLVDRVFIEDIEYLISNRNSPEQTSTEDDRMYTFMGLGLISQKPKLTEGHLIFHYENTEHGNNLLDFGFIDPTGQQKLNDEN